MYGHEPTNKVDFLFFITASETGRGRIPITYAPHDEEA
jgi:hypothetical protein